MEKMVEVLLFNFFFCIYNLFRFIIANKLEIEFYLYFIHDELEGPRDNVVIEKLKNLWDEVIPKENTVYKFLKPRRWLRWLTIGGGGSGWLVDWQWLLTGLHDSD